MKLELIALYIYEAVERGARGASECSIGCLRCTRDPLLFVCTDRLHMSVDLGLYCIILHLPGEKKQRREVHGPPPILS